MSTLPTKPTPQPAAVHKQALATSSYSNNCSVLLSPFSYTQHATSVVEAVMSPPLQTMDTPHALKQPCASTSHLNAGTDNHSLDAAHTATLVGALSAPTGSHACPTNSVGSVGGPWPPLSTQHAARISISGCTQQRKYFKYHMQRLQTTANHVLFYVVDAESVAHLAIVGTDVRLSGHFVYCTLPDFKDGPPVRCTNRVKVMEWLSALGATECADPDHVQVPAISQQQLDMLLTSDPMFTKPTMDRDYSTWREEGGRLPDGRHFKNFYLVHPPSGAERLVITAEDSHRRDRRYAYKAVQGMGGFTFENGQAVKEWLDFITGRTASCAPTRPSGRARSVTGGAGRKMAKHGHGSSLVPSPSCTATISENLAATTATSLGSMGLQLAHTVAKGPLTSEAAAVITEQQRFLPATVTTGSKPEVHLGTSSVLGIDRSSMLGARMPLSLSVPLPSTPPPSSIGPLLRDSTSNPLPGIVFPDQSAAALLAIPMGVCTYQTPPASTPYTSPEIQDAFSGDSALLEWITTAPEPAAVARVRMWCCWLRTAARSDLLGTGKSTHDVKGGSDAADHQQPQQALQKVVEVIDCLQSEQISLRLLEATQALPVISKLQAHPCHVIADRAWQLSASWRATAAAALSKTTAALQAAGVHLLP